MDELGEAPPNVRAVGDGAVVVTFLRISPGDEEALAEHLCESYTEGIVSEVFGSSDFAVVEFGDSWSELSRLEFSRKDFDVFEIVPVRCFPWYENCEWNDLVNTSQGVLGFCFIKMSAEAIREEGLGAEKRAAVGLRELASRRHKGVQVHVLGTLGWHELLVLICSDDMGAIERYVLNVRAGAGLQTPDGNPLIESTATTLSVRCKAGKPSPTARFGVVTPILMVASHPRLDQEIHAYLDRNLGKTSWTFGSHDFMCRVKQFKWVKDYLSLLWEFRRANRYAISGTVTYLAGPIRKRAPMLTAVPSKVAKSKTQTISAPSTSLLRMQQLHENSPEMAGRVVDVFASLNNYQGDDLTAGAFSDLTEYAKALRRELLQRHATDEEDPVKDLELLTVYLDTLLFGIQQRAFATGSFEPSRHPPLHPNRHGGIHRVLTALSCVAADALESAGRSWHGFFLVGFTGDFRRYSLGVINVPWEALDDISSWVAIAHESGHELGAQLDMNRDPGIVAMLADTGHTDDYTALLVWEVMCQVFATLVTYGSDRWTDYLQQSWTYISARRSARRETRLRSFFLRLLLADLFFRQRAQEKVDDGAVDEAGRKLAMLMIKENALLEKMWRSGQLNGEIQKARRLVQAGLLQHLERLLNNVNDRGPLLYDTRPLAAGYASVDPSLDSLELLQALNFDAQAKDDWRAGVSALLSLWHKQVTRAIR